MSDQGDSRPKATVVLGTPDEDVESPAHVPRQGADTFLLHPSMPEPMHADDAPVPEPLSVPSDPAPPRDAWLTGAQTAEDLPTPEAAEPPHPRQPAASEGMAPPMSPPAPKADLGQLPPYIYSELRRYVQDQLARFAVAGQLSTEDSALVLATPSSKARYELGEWLRGWPDMPEASRLRQAAEIARELSSQRAPASSARAARKIHIDLRMALPAVALLLVIAYLYTTGGPAAADSDSSPSQATPRELDSPSPSSSERATRVCAATRSRIHQGGSVTLADVEGWVVDIALLREGPSGKIASRATLQRFVESPEAPEGSRFIWKNDPGLGGLNTSDSVVRVRPISLSNETRQAASGVVLTFGGTLVDPYFSERGRSRFHAVALALADSLEATHAAVYAHCDGDEHHVMASWFRGKDSGAVTTSLLYFLGTYASPPHISAPFLGAPGATGIDRYIAFNNISRATRPIDRAALATIIGSEGGLATGTPDGPVYVTFPFKDGNRAARASRSLARVASLGR